MNCTNQRERLWQSTSDLPSGTEPLINDLQNVNDRAGSMSSTSTRGNDGFSNGEVGSANNQTQNVTQLYEEEWRRFFKGLNYTEYIKNQGLGGLLRSCRFRSVCWRVYLECLPDDQSGWISETTKARNRYEIIKSKYLKNPRIDDYAVDLKLNNPLSQDETSPWNQYFQDGELKVTIRQDVIRTFPETEFFHSQHIRDMMVNILFCYAREFPHVSYKQGMHELLAPIIFVLHSDHQAFLHALETELLEDLVKFLLDPNSIEHDAFFMFSQVMEVAESWYLVRDVYPNEVDAMTTRLFARPQDMNPTNVIIFKLTRIQDQLLKKYDPDLYYHLERLEIAPQIYGIRWLRLLFGREFPLLDLLVIWDVIFADSMAFDLVDYIFVSMLIFIRELLLTSDYASCLMYLMKYPAVTDVQYVINVALHLREPTKFSKPYGYSTQMLQHRPTVGGRVDIHHAPVQNGSVGDLRDQIKKSNKVTSGFATLTKKITTQPKTLTLNRETAKPMGLIGIKSSSELTTFESRSPSPALTDYIQDPSGISNKVENSKSMASTSQAETELQPLTVGRREVSRSSTKVEEKAEEAGAGTGSPNLTRKMNRKGSWTFKRNKDHSRNREFQETVQDGAYFQGQLHDLQAMCTYCSSKMTIHIDHLQDCVLRQNLESEDEMLIALAGLKQVRDILKGTLKFTHNILDGDDIIINDDHYQLESTKANVQSQAEVAAQLEKIHLR